jgi:long-subunit fatty acid transport protein
MVQLLMNEYVQGSSNNKKGIDDFISDFNKNNKAGITLVAGNSIRTDGTDITIDIIYKGKKQVTETYKKLDDAH